MLKFVFAPDSFKGSLSAVEICRGLTRAANRHFPDAATQSLPVADGGEGTVDALLMATGGQKRGVSVSGPLREPVTAAYGVLPGGCAVLEMAQASGLALIAPDRLDPLGATSFGTGEMIRHALEAGFRRLLIGIGGSATNDGGMGMLAALGARFAASDGRRLAGSGQDLADIAQIDLTRLHPALAEAEITVLCDVNNPLLGEAGATAVYGPQKGASPQALARLEAGMRHYAKQMETQAGKDIASFPGSGAAGGVGGALAGVLGATLRPGIDAVLDAVGFERHLQAASLVITGEGRIDSQSIRFRKAPAGVAARCAARNIPVVALVGGMAEGAEQLYDLAESSILTTVNAAMPLERALKEAKPLLESAADRLFRMLKIGASLRR